MTITPLVFTAPLTGKNVTEQRVMREFASEHENYLRFDHDRGRWLLWEDHHWQIDHRRKAFWWVLEFCWKLGVNKAQRIGFATAVENGSRTIPPIATHASDWNPNPLLVACPAGVIELETGALRDGAPADMIDRALTVVPDASLPADTFFAFLEKIFPQDGMIDFLQRWCGYSLSGLVSEHKFLFLHGTGANGKGTLLSLLAHIWGDLCVTASIDTFLETKHERHSQDLARLSGTHMVQIHETREGRRWDEAKIKMLTGGDPITARFMRRDDFTFMPRFKPMFAGNHRPHLRTVDEAMRRRILLVPCTVTIPVDQRDPKLGEKLQAEAPRILAWAIDGFDQWRRFGLKPPDCVLDATEEYLTHQDDMQLWLDECCNTQSLDETASKDLFLSWTQWKTLRGEHPGSQRSFNDKLVDKGFVRKIKSQGIVFEKIKLAMAPSYASASYYSP